MIVGRWLSFFEVSFSHLLFYLETKESLPTHVVKTPLSRYTLTIFFWKNSFSRNFCQISWYCDMKFEYWQTVVLKFDKQ